MSRLEIPISGQNLFSTGDVKLLIEMSLALKDHTGRWHRRTFRVDTGTEVTTFPAFDARRLGLPMPAQANRGAIHAQTGLEVRSGVLRFRIEGMDPTEYVIACVFLGDPAAPPGLSPPAARARPLLQPSQLLDQLRFTLDKNPLAGLPYGELVVETR